MGLEIGRQIMAKESTGIGRTSEDSPFERIKRVNDAGNEFWSSRDFARVLDYANYRNFEQVIGKAKTACFNSGQRLEDHFVDIDEMIEIGKGAQRAVNTTLMSRYACYLAKHQKA
jgi:DNA-damage-inducible protein D